MGKLVFLLLLALVERVTSHAYLSSPPSRRDSVYTAGTLPTKISNGGTFPLASTILNSCQGSTTAGSVTGVYNPGDTISVSWVLSIPHVPSGAQAEYVRVALAGSPTTLDFNNQANILYYNNTQGISGSVTDATYTVSVTLPSSNCSNCVLQWVWDSESDGGGYVDCADIQIGTVTQQPAPVNCTLNAWGAWGPCSATCGTGTYSRTRTVNTTESNGGSCVGPFSQTTACPSLPGCTTNCTLSAWSAWGACSATCGAGTITRTRSINTPATNGGSCGSTTESTPCPSLPACSSSCVGVVCLPISECHAAGVCTLGNCSTPLRPKGTLCNFTANGNVTVGYCSNGKCMPPMIIPPPTYKVDQLVPPYTTVDPTPWCMARNPALCPPEGFYPYAHERVAWALVNAARLDVDGFAKKYGKQTLCSSAYRRAQPLYWDSKLQQASKFHSYAMAFSPNCGRQENTCSESCGLFAGSCDAGNRLRAYLNVTFSIDKVALNPSMVRVDTLYDPLELVLRWTQGWNQDWKNEWTCNSLVANWMDSGALAYYEKEGSRYNYYWTLSAASRANWWQRRPWLSPLYGGGGHFMYKDQIRFILNYYSQYLPDFVDLVFEDQNMAMRLHSGKSADGLLFGTAQGTFYIDVPVPGGDEYCRSYYFLVRNRDATFRFPETGHFLTYNISGCMEDYSPSNTPTEFVPVPGAPFVVNFTVFGWNDNGRRFDLGSFRWRLRNNFYQAYNFYPAFYTLYENHTWDNSTAVWTFFALNEKTQWPINGALFTDLLTTNQATKLDLYDFGRGGTMANYSALTGPSTGSNTDSAAHVETKTHQISAAVILAVASVAILVGSVLLRGKALPPWSEYTRHLSYTSHAYNAAAICLTLWILICVAQTSTYWAQTAEPSTLTFGLWKFCYEGQPCQDSLQATEGGQSSLKAARGFLVLGQFGGVAAWVSGLILGMTFLYEKKNILIHVLCGGMIFMSVCTLISVCVFIAYFNDVLRPQPFTNFYPHWGWALATLVMIGSYVAALFAYPLILKDHNYGASTDPNDAPGPKKVGPWQRFWDDENKDFYYYNHKTNESKWEKPAGF